MNSVYGETEITLRGDINVGMAVALEEGFIVPVVRHANQLTMKQLVQESARLAAAARDGTLTPDDLHDGTFTVSALGMFGVDSFTPIINSPQSGILGVNRIRDGVRWEGATPSTTIPPNRTVSVLPSNCRSMRSRVSRCLTSSLTDCTSSLVAMSRMSFLVAV